MAFIIPVSDEEKQKVKQAIIDLNKIGHLKYMSQTTIASSCGIKATKIRLILQELLDEKQIIQYVANENKRLNRYYYIINDQYQPPEE